MTITVQLDETTARRLELLERALPLIEQLLERLQGAGIAAEPVPAMLTVREAAGALAVSPNAVYGLINAGQLHSVRLGPQSIRIPRSELNRLQRGGGG